MLLLLLNGISRCTARATAQKRVKKKTQTVKYYANKSLNNERDEKKERGNPTK